MKKVNIRYAIYGVNRVAKDFLYIFDDLRYTVCFASDNENGKKFEKIINVPVFSDSEIVSHRADFDMIIVCDFDFTRKVNVLMKMGMKLGDDYVLAEDLLESLNTVVINPDNKPVYVWGAGRNGEKVYQNLTGRFQIDRYIDRNPQDGWFHEYNVVSPDAVNDWRNHFTIVSVKKNDEILSCLNNLGLKHFEDYCTFDEFMNVPSEMLRKTIFQKEVYDFQCETMLNHVEVGGDGALMCCCSTFINNDIGRIEKGVTFESKWDSIVHKIMCLSNVNRTYSFCLTQMCPFFIKKEYLYDYHLAEPYRKMEKSPRTVAVGFDFTCNLKCSTCRSDFRIASKKQQAEMMMLSDTIKEEVLPGCEFLIMAGDGEVLLSKPYQSIYDDDRMKNVKWLRLLTNGLLFTQEKWQELRSHTDAKIMMTVSIDAASSDTYSKIRRGGNFELLKKRMEYAALLRAGGELSYLRFNFVVQRENYKEMTDFVKWGESLGIDECFFTKILNWGTYTREEFKKISMMEEDGITPKPELQEVLDNPIMKHSIVDLGTIRYQHEEASIDDVDNYYRWELERKVHGLFHEKS